MTQVIIGLVRLTFARPRDGFQAVLDLAPSTEARWLAVAIIAVLNVMITQATLIGVPPETMPAWVAAMQNPVRGALSQVVTMLYLAFGMSVVARAFGGRAAFRDALWLVAWVEFLLVCAEVAMLAVSFLVPAAGTILAYGVIALLFWLLTQATKHLNGFRNPFLVFLGVLGAMILTGVLLFSLLAQAGLAPVLVTGGPGV